MPTSQLIELALWLAGTVISHGLLEIWITAAPQVDAARFCGTPRVALAYLPLTFSGLENNRK
jgi:hypothetical protein